MLKYIHKHSTVMIPVNDLNYIWNMMPFDDSIAPIGGIGCDGVDCGQSRHCLDAVEIYNAEGDYWKDGTPLPSAQLSLRTNACNAGAVAGKIYVCGYYKGAGK